MKQDFEKKTTLCWSCANAAGKCTWSDKLKPVRGWTAEKTKIKCSPVEFVDSYYVIACPRFKKDRERPRAVCQENYYA